jgi:hypothetical protein
MRGETVSTCFSTRRYGLAIAFALCAGILGACSSHVVPLPSHIVPASKAQFEPPLTVTVSSGSSGIEVPAPGKSHWWLTSPDAAIAVTNNRSTKDQLVLTGLVSPTPCPRVETRVIMTSGDTTPATFTVGATGTPFSLSLRVRMGATNTVRVAVTTPVCHIPRDPRPFYAGLIDLSVRPIG